MRIRNCPARLVVLLGALVCAAAPSAAAVAELTLDRAAVQDLLAAALPPALDVELRGLGRVTLELGDPRGTAFVDGAVETTLQVRLPVTGLTADLRLRYEPEIEPLYGTPLLRAVTARIDALDLDVAPLVPPATLPRRADWSFALEPASGSRELSIACFVQGIAIDDERLRLDLGLRVTAGR